MTDQNSEWLTEQPAATLLLAAYVEREAQLPKRPARTAVAAATAAASPIEPPPPAVETEPAAPDENAADEAENADAWCARVTALEGVDAEKLSQLHGGLIARGYLKYELFGRQLGLRYRLTPDGRRAAESTPTTAPLTAEIAA
ncbi:MAG TPA: hypothetical protein VM452_00620 [Caulifigura sp.]|jgi:hypothetical protein|nr:hypothetical protein [Caulifigura sp.]